MKLVLDSNVALKTVLPESDSGHAIRLIADYKQGLHELLAPDVFPVEVGHALTRAERQKRIQPPDGWRFWNAIMVDAPTLHPCLPVMQVAFGLSSTLRVGLYDCLYVALARRESCRVVTADQRLLSVFPNDTIPLQSI
jgi:predicted nucleic acid-binding protein